MLSIWGHISFLICGIYAPVVPYFLLCSFMLASIRGQHFSSIYLVYSLFHLYHRDLIFEVHMYQYQRLGFAPTMFSKERLNINLKCGYLVI